MGKMTRITLADWLRYKFDSIMSRGTVALMGWLALVTVVATAAVSGIVWSAGISTEISLLEQFWAYLMEALDATAWSGPWSFRLVSSIVTFTGVFVTSVLIGLLATGIGNKIEDLRKGRSSVIESGHTVILGWSPMVFPIISELLVANRNQPDSCIVILGDEGKVEMEEQIRARVGESRRTRVVCRRGQPMEMADLKIVSLHTAKSIIILAPETDDPDSSIIKTMLAITKDPSRRKESYHIVAEIHDEKNLDVARIVGKDEAEFVLSGDLIARITAQTCRHPGLSAVYTELLDFAGDEIYLQEEPELAGRTFGEALLAYEDSAILGLCPKGESPKLNPPMNTLIREGDQIIAISEDDDTVRISGLPDLGIDRASISTAQPLKPVAERVLVIGWNWRAPFIINELEHYVAPGSVATVAAAYEEGEAVIARQCAEVEKQKVSFRYCDSCDRRMLDALEIETYDHVILLSYSDVLDAHQADARTLITLLHLRDIADRTGHTFSIVSEMLDIRNRKLAEVTRPDDFVVSDRLISLILSQVSENKALGAVFTDLFSPKGSELYLRPAANYVELGAALNFYTVVEAARQQGQVALGYRLEAHAQDPAKGYGVVLNPDKSVRVTYAGGDQIIVLAEE